MKAQRWEGARVQGVQVCKGFKVYEGTRAGGYKGSKAAKDLSRLLRFKTF